MAKQMLLNTVIVLLELLNLISCTSQAQAEKRKGLVEAKKLKFSTTDIFNSSADLDLNEAPLCSIVFTRQISVQQDEEYEPIEVEKHIFLIPYEDGVLANPYKGWDKVIEKTFNGSRIPPLVEIRCISLYLTRFKFVGVEAIQFFSIRNTRNVNETYGRYVHEITVQVLLTSSATGEYVVQSIDNSSLSKSVTIVSERERGPYMLGYGRVLQGEANDTTVVIPCIAAKYKTVIYLRYRADENYYSPIFNSGQSPLFGNVVRYDRRYGFILSIKNKLLLKQLLKGYWKADGFPFGEYKCETSDSPDDNVVVFVKAVPDPPKDVSSSKLALDIKQNGAVCVGYGSAVNLTKYDIQRQESHEFLRCLAEGGQNPTCGSQSAGKEEGLSYADISVITGLSSSGFLVCSSDFGDINHLFYFRGLSGTLYTQRWQDVPKSDLLRVKVNIDVFGNSDKDVELYPVGIKVYAFCEIAGKYINQALVYVKYRNDPILVLKGQATNSIYNAVPIELTPELEEVICNFLPSDSNMPIIVSKQIIIYCNDSSNYFGCHNGRCINNSQVCNAEDDCGDNSDEELNNCKQKYLDRAPKVINKQNLVREVVQNEMYSLTCQVKVEIGQDPELQWINNDGEINSRYEINEISKSYETVYIFTITFNATKDDEYKCIARNRFGNDSATYRIVTQGACNGEGTNNNCPTVPELPRPTTNPTPSPIVKVPADDPEAVGMPQPFSCTSEGKFPDPYNCGIYHECVAGRRNEGGEYLNYEFACGIGTVY